MSDWAMKWRAVAEARRRDRRRALWNLAIVLACLLALALIHLSGGCAGDLDRPASGFTDEQWEAFCPDGHCPVYKLGKAVNEAGDARMPE